MTTVRTFTVTVRGEVDPDDDSFADAAEFADYLRGEVTYRVENETPEGLTVAVSRVEVQP